MSDYELIRPVSGPDMWRGEVGNAARIQLSDQQIEEILEMMEATAQFQNEIAEGEPTEISIDKSYKLLLGDMPQSQDPRYTAQEHHRRLFQQPQHQDEITLEEEGWTSMMTRLWPGQVAWYDSYHDDVGGTYELFVEVVHREDLMLMQMMRVEEEKQEKLLEKLAERGNYRTQQRMVWGALRGAGRRRSSKQLQKLEAQGSKEWKQDTRFILEALLLEDPERARQSWKALCQNFPESAARCLKHSRMHEHLHRHDLQPLLEHDSTAVRRQTIRQLGGTEPGNDANMPPDERGPTR